MRKKAKEALFFSFFEKSKKTRLNQSLFAVWSLFRYVFLRGMKDAKEAKADMGKAPPLFFSLYLCVCECMGYKIE